MIVGDWMKVAVAVGSGALVLVAVGSRAGVLIGLTVVVADIDVGTPLGEEAALQPFRRRMKSNNPVNSLRRPLRRIAFTAVLP